MKLIISVLTVMTGVMFAASLALANPALLKKHEGYPDPDTKKGTTATGEAAELKAAEDAPKKLTNQLREAAGGVENQSQLKRAEDSRLPAVVGPGHVAGSQGVSENQIKEATKIKAEPK
jgi:hypothetical protein